MKKSSHSVYTVPQQYAVKKSGNSGNSGNKPVLARVFDKKNPAMVKK
ncbi:hypothetical protein [Aggregatibacter kilianii]|nr:hypothetical protein [Aggregatibacter kilianii]